MKQVLRTIVFLIFCGVMGLQPGHAQQYPVQANMTIAGPAPSTVSGFVPGHTSRINVNLLLNDVTTPSLDVRLRFIFEGPGFTIQTSPNAIVPDYTLQGGVPQNLGVTLEPYFQPNAFQLLNGSWGSFMPNGLLPEGNYTIKLQVLEPRRNVVISNTAITMAWVMLNDPPSIVQPADGAQLDPGAVQNVMFSWIPQNSVNPTGGHQIQYALELWEVPANADPNVTAGSMPSTYSYQLPMTTLIWNPSYPVLNPGSHYVCRVTASDPSNQVSFKNQGHSEPIMFQYGSACQTPLNPTHSEVDITQARISWVARPGSDQFRVEFIPTDADVGEEWRTIDTVGETALVQSLAPATSYNYRVRAVCGGFMSEPTMERTFTTNEMEPLNNECNLELETPEIDDEFLREDLEPLDMIWTGSFPMTIDEIESQNGTRFTGRGRLNMPLFNVSIRARFEDMEVTLLNKMASGTVSAMQGDSVTFNYGGGNGGGGGPGGEPGGGDIPTPDDTVNVNNPIDSLEQINDSTWIVYNGGDVDTAMVAAGGATYISDGAGTEVVVTEDDYFNVDEDGDGGPGGGADHDPVQDMIACERQIEFILHSMSKYGMEAYRDPPVTGYQTLTMGTQVTGIGWKAMATDETGMLRVEVNDSDTDELDFQYQSGGTGVSTDGDAASGYTLSLQTPDGNEDILLAVCDRDTTTGEASIAGGIGVAAYERLALEVKVVPVGHELNYTEGQLEDALNDIYGQAVVSWNVEYLAALDINYWDENGDGLIERPNTDYSNEMRAVWESFLASMQYDPVQQGQAYLFVIPGITEGGDVRGYMPIKSRYGFVTAEATTRDVAHELGHGVFNLRHTFSEENSFTLPQGETENLMDYSTGTELWKYQWDFIHNPEGGWHIFEDVEEGEMVAVGDSIRFDIVNFESEFAPGIGNLLIEYELSEDSKPIIDKYPNEDLRINMVIADKNDNIIYEKSLGAEKEGAITWDGYLNEEKSDSLIFENGPFKLGAIVSLGDINFTNWDAIEDMIYEVIVGDSVKLMTHRIDTVFNIVTGAKLEWIVNEDMHGWVVNINNDPTLFDAYNRMRDIYMTYTNVQEAGDPFTYLKENLETVEFLGKNLYVHNEFKGTLDSVKSILVNSGIYESLKSKYESLSVATLAMRTKNDNSGGGSVSAHGFGMAIDIVPKKNPQIYASNEYVRFLIKQSTGFDLNSSKTANEVKSAHNRFVEVFHNQTVDLLKEKYIDIYDYNLNETNIKLSSIQCINQTLDSIKGAFNMLVPESNEYEVNVLKNKAFKFSSKINDLAGHIGKYRYIVIFDDAAINQIDVLQNKLLVLKNELIDFYNMLEDTVPSEIEDFTQLNEIEYNSLQIMTESFFSEQMDLCDDLNTFANELADGINDIPFENELLKDGFCDLELDLINAFLNADPRVHWGGVFSTSKIDGMHFGFKSNAINSILNAE